MVLSFKPFLTGALLFSSFFVHAQAVLGEIPLEANKNLIAPIRNVANHAEVIISRKQYVISYNKETRNPNWVAWKLEISDMGNVPRQKNFTTDLLLDKHLKEIDSSNKAVTAYEYKGSCFDRGHQVPSADRDATLEDNKATFMMSNVVPQTANMNRNVWEHLEQYTRNQVLAGKTAYVIAGAVYDEDFGKIGPNHDILVPSKTFKVVAFLGPQETLKDLQLGKNLIVVDVPNLTSKGTKPFEDQETLCQDYQVKTGDTSLGSLLDWKVYESTLSEVESVTGFKLLPL